MESSHQLTDDVPLDVTLLVESEVLRRGVGSLLTQIPWVTLVDRPAGRTESPDSGPGRASLILATLPEWRQLTGEDLLGPGTRPFVLLIGDDIHASDLSLPVEVPCDGVISLREATVPLLDTTLRRVVEGDMPLPAPLARELLAGSRGPVRRHTGRRAVSFTDRERETLGLLAQGYSNKQIAKALGISAHGVKRLVGAILLKLGAPNRTTAAVMAMNERLL